MKAQLLLLLTLPLATVVAQQPLRFWPQAGEPGRDLAATNLFDYIRVNPDPPPGGEPKIVETFRCDGNAADGHGGTDALLRSFAEAELGVPVFAALDGRICSLADSFYDQCTSRQVLLPGCNPRVECSACTGNHVHLMHENGLATWYAHLKRGSVPAHLRAGSCVEAGEQIGLTASSGSGNWPHLHFQVTDNGSPIDPFGGPCNHVNSSMWSTQPTFRSDLRLWDVGLSKDDSSAIEPPAARIGGGWVAQGATSIHVWGIFVALGTTAGQAVTFTFEVRDDMGNTIPGVLPHTLAMSAGRLRWFHETLALPATLAPGDWQVHINATAPAQMSEVIAPFEIVATGAPVPNHPPETPTQVRFDPPQPTAADAIFCRFDLPVVDDRDYDVVRLHYVWTNTDTNTVIRDVVHAGQADAIPRQPQGAAIECRVTALDGRDGVSGTVAVSTVIAAGTAPACPTLEIVPCQIWCNDFQAAGWRNLGNAKSGPSLLALPLLRAETPLVGGTTLTLKVRGGSPSSVATLFLSAVPGNLPFACTLFVPGQPASELTTSIDAEGSGTFSIPLPPGLPPGNDLFWQAWMPDAQASFQLSATNGLVGTTR